MRNAGLLIQWLTVNRRFGPDRTILIGMACVAAGGVVLTIALLMSKPIRTVRP